MPLDFTHKAAGIRPTIGDVPRLAARPPWNTETAEITERHTQHAKRRGAHVALAPVADVLARYGFDPAEELARLLTEMVPVLDARGQPVIGEDGKPVMRHVLPLDEHAKLTAELLQYTRPKLKSSEITVKPPDLTDDQLDRRIEALLKRAGGARS